MSENFEPSISTPESPTCATSFSISIFEAITERISPTVGVLKDSFAILRNSAESSSISSRLSAGGFIARSNLWTRNWRFIQRPSFSNSLRRGMHIFADSLVRFSSAPQYIMLADLKSLESSPRDFKSSRKHNTVLIAPERISFARASSVGEGYSLISPVTKAPRIFGVRSADTSLPSSSPMWLAI